MPSRRRATDSDSDTRGSSGQKRQASHTSRACDACRKRKMRCDALHPLCTMCKERNIPCEFRDEDRRKTNAEHMEAMNARMDRFERLIVDLSNRRSEAQIVVAEPQIAPVPLSFGCTTSQNPISLELPSLSQLSRQAAQSSAQSVAQSSNSYIIQPFNVNASSSRIASLGATDGYEQFQRVEDAAGTLIQYGPTSLWTLTSPKSHRIDLPEDPMLRPGDWINWSQHLPKALDIDRVTHDLALGFLEDLSLCNTIRAPNTLRRPPPSRTSHYSPLLHCCVLYLGLAMTRQEHPGLVANYEAVFTQHCSPLLLNECDYPALSSLKAYNLFANCTHFVRMSSRERSDELGRRQYATGYLYSGMAIAGVHALGLNLSCDSAVLKGSITAEERSLREYAFWTIYMMDTIRSLASGRLPMLLGIYLPPLPRIDETMDTAIWTSPSRGFPASSPTLLQARASNQRSMISTTFHWGTKLAIICRSILEDLYSPGGEQSARAEYVPELNRRLDAWSLEVPLRMPESTPLPHILLLHMTYHLAVIFVNRPFYRSSLVSSASKCDHAATSILHLVHVFDASHTVHLCHHNLINILFGAATIFLLRSVGASDDKDATKDLQYFNDCMEFMARLGVTWMEASMSRDILVKLQSEYYRPQAGHPVTTDVSTATMTPFEGLDDIPDFWATMAGQDFQWDGLDIS